MENEYAASAKVASGIDGTAPRDSRIIKPLPSKIVSPRITSPIIGTRPLQLEGDAKAASLTWSTSLGLGASSAKSSHGNNHVVQPADDQVTAPESNDAQAHRSPSLFRFDLPTSSSSPADSLLQTCQLMLPYWPADPFHRELTLLKYGGKSGAQILNEMHEKGTDYYSASNAGEDDAGDMDMERETMEGPLRGRRAAIVESHRELRSIAPSNTVSSLELPAAGEEESLRIDEASNNHKKRKSAGAASRNGHEDRLTSSSPARGQHSSAANRLLRELGARSRPRSTLAEVTEDDQQAIQDDEDGIERPDVSSATFRASRLVDDLYSEGVVDSEDNGHDEELEDADHPLCDARLSRATRPTHEDVKLLYRAYLSREPWSQRHRDRIREKIKSRLVLKRAVDSLKEAQADELRKAEDKSAEDKAKDREGEKKPSTSAKKLTKAEQRVKAAKGSSSVAGLKKPTLAEIRARTMGAQGKQSDHHKFNQTATQPISSKSSSPAVAAIQAQTAAISTRCPPLRGDFTMQFPSPITARLQQSRQIFSDLLAQPFDQVMSQLRLPNVLKDKTSAWPSIGSTLLESRIPMLCAGRDTQATGQTAQSRKWLPSTVSSTGELSRLRSDFAGLRIRSSDKDKATAWAFVVPIAAKQRQATDKDARLPSALLNKASTLPTQSPATSAAAITDKQTDDLVLDPSLPANLSSKPPPLMANARAGPATIPPAANARQSSATPSITSPPIPSSPKVPKMSRRRKANMHNPHHVSNSSKWLNSTGSNVRRVASDADHQPPGLDHPTTTSALFPDEFICMFCEYELFYGKKSRLLKACKCRKERLRKEKAAREGRKTGRKNLPRLENSRMGGIDGGSTNDGTSSVRDDCCCDDCREHALQEAAANDRGIISSDFAGDGLPPLVPTDAVDPSTMLPSDIDDTASFADAGSLLPSMATTTAKKNVSRMIAAIARSPYVRQRLLAELAAMADLFPEGDAAESSGQADQEEMRKWIEELGHLHPTEDVDGESDLRWLDSKVAGEDEALRTLPKKFFEFFGRVLRDQQAAAKETSTGRRSSAPEL